MFLWRNPHILIILGLLILSSLSLSGQTDRQYVIDSLESHVLEGQADTSLYTILWALSMMKAKANTDSAVAYAWQMIALADRMGELPRQIKARCVLGGVYFRANMMDSVEQATLRAISIADACAEHDCWFEKMHAIKQLRFPLRSRGQVKQIVHNWEDFLTTPDLPNSIAFEVRRLMSYPMMEMGDHDGALRELSRVWEYGKEANDQALLCNALGELSGLYDLMGKKDKSLEVVKERLRICQSLGDFYATRHTHNQLGHSYVDVEQYDSAVWHLQKVIEMSKSDEHVYPYALGGLIVATPFVDPGLTQQYVDDMKAAMRRHEEGLSQFMHQRQFIYGTLSRYYLSVNQYASAERYAKERLDLVRQYQSDTTDLAVDALELLAQTQAASGKYAPAWDNYTAFHDLRMTMISRNQEKELARTAVELELAENELARQIAEQEAELERQASATQTRFLLTILAVGGIVLAVVLWAFRRAQADKRIISEKNLQIEESLAEKEVLLREIHHRVKNNLQIISGLLDRQARKSSDESVRRLVREGQERIQSMALIHQNLYESEQLSGIDIKTYLRELSGNIQHSQLMNPGEEAIQLELDVAEGHLDIDTAIPVGLILNELLTNCYKYAFKGRAGGKISVAFNKNNDQYELFVRDDGIGFNPDDAARKRSLGLSLVRGLVRQLDGTIEWLKVERGTAVAIIF
ncbi:MAG: histidine kinase dimerization/phosphoacceptor domain -containing protein [Bacteroidota bacterium]